MIHRLSRDQVVWRNSSENPPAVQLDPGDSAYLETQDGLGSDFAETGHVQTESYDIWHSMPTTGPVFIRGAEPGDCLVVHIDQITPAPVGWMAKVTGWGVLPLEGGPDAVETWVVPIHDGVAWLPKDVVVPITPNCGYLGVAPDGDPVPNPSLGDYGGTMDIKDARVGTIVLLPVFVPGALFAVGDVHAVQGDGEVLGTGVECEATVGLTFGLRKGYELPRPQMITPDSFMTIGYGETTDEAARMALGDAIDVVRRHTRMSWNEAYMFCGATADIRTNQIAGGTLGARAVIPRHYLPSVVNG